MLIDWFTVGAQVVNFLILLVLLRMFLFKPIKEAVRKREEAVASKVRQAEKSLQDVKASREELEREKLALERSKERILKQAEQEAQEYLDEALEKVHEETRAAREAWQAELAREQEASADRLRRKVTKTAFRVAGKVLADMTNGTPDGELERRAAAAFLQKLDSAENSQAGKKMRGTAEIITGFSDKELEADLVQGVKGRFPNIESVQYSVDDSLGFGVLLKAGDARIEWTPETYLSSLELDVQDALSSSAKQVAS